ncbi:MAG: hypothetical protein AB1602_01335 [Elusimicrobiota bacterium]
MRDNKMKVIKIIVIIIMGLNIEILLKGQTTGSFLKFTNDAKLISGGIVGIDDGGLSGLNITPAIRITNNEIRYTGTRIMDEISYHTLISGIKLKSSNIGLMMTECGVDGIETRDDNGQKTGSFNTRNSVIGINYSYELNRKDIIGITIKHISMAISEKEAGSMGIDIGYGRIINRNTEIGLSIRNLSKGIKLNRTNEQLPSGITVMYGYRIMEGIRLGVSITRWIDAKTPEYIIGFGYNILNWVELRSNYTYAKLNSEETKTIRYGIGIKLNKAELNYASQAQGRGITNSISIGTKF